MVRIPGPDIEWAKQEVSLERLVQAQGIERKRHGADLLGLWPFHDDHEPSLVVSPKKNLWHCLGACQTGGSVIDRVMKSRISSCGSVAPSALVDRFPWELRANSSPSLRR
jgi:DNA primase